MMLAGIPPRAGAATTKEAVVDLPNGTQRMSLVRILTAGADRKSVV